MFVPLAEKLKNSFEQYPLNIAIKTEKQDITYKELNTITDLIALNLLKNVKCGDSQPVVAINLNNTLEQLLTILACIKIGAAYVPICVNLPSERQDLIYKELKANIKDRPIILANDFQKLTEKNNSGEFNSFKITPDSWNYIIFTSGTTSTPKGAVVTYGNTDNFLNSLESLPWKLNSNDHFIQNVSYSFDPSFFTTFMTLTAGATLLLPVHTKDIFETIDLIKKYKIRLLHAGPSLLSLLVAENSFSECMSLKLVFGGGEAWSGALLKNLHKAIPTCEFLNVYGPTETTIHVTTWHCKNLAKVPDKIPIGKAIKNTKILILDDDLQVVDSENIGEICILGDSVAAGYINEQSASAFVAYNGQKMYRTKDLGYYKNDNLYFVGRLDNQVKLRGHRIQLEEIESHIKKINGISICSALKVDTKNNSMLIAYFVADTHIDKDLIFTRLKNYLPDFMVPHQIIQIDNMPLNNSQKPDRNELYEIFIKDYESSLKDTANKPQTEVEIQKFFVKVWRQVLQNEQIDASSDFFANGGDSLQSLDIVMAMEEEYGQEISIVDVFTYPTPEKLSKHLSELFGNTNV